MTAEHQATQGCQEKRGLRGLMGNLDQEANLDGEEILDKKVHKDLMGQVERRENEGWREAEAARGKTDSRAQRESMGFQDHGASQEAQEASGEMEQRDTLEILDREETQAQVDQRVTMDGVDSATLVQEDPRETAVSRGDKDPVGAEVNAAKREHPETAEHQGKMASRAPRVRRG